ncbi:MAG: hypothetical protein LBD23_12600 [Oscillospiraceae bacterium]|jgi:hypothetical protein|nr:hypothetical protein [Oscillospiraceae bacterium]
MGVQFKYAFMTGLQLRGIAFAVISVMNLVFIILGMLGALPFAAKITAVSLAGVAISVMMVINIICDVSIIRRMFTAPGAYLYALTPTHRWKTLFASTITMFAKDIVTITTSIIGVTWLSLILAGEFADDVTLRLIWETILANSSDILFGLWFVALFIAGYLLIIMIITFCITARKSIFYQKRAGGLLTALLALATIYVVNIMALALAPFSDVVRWGFMFTVYISRSGLIAYVFLTLTQAAALFYATSKLMERKMNI